MTASLRDRVIAACAAYTSSRSALRAIEVHRSSRGSATIWSRSRVIWSRSARSKYTSAVSATSRPVPAATSTMSNAE